ncbi:hypothetical protein [Mangrovibacterium diazotrophicum]|uniref:Uncharacterized protein n=1 Tax=Mangrovibacterium diazotrophicum TaxID=1261403 RepID=A0A419VV12_9BACT|nr:hypothetical protein [Mangrovibacterium diazotrophicum]RKD85997.1 hypothetical protein BC643_4313 [Mangrovibacterium diazotrophicum]
MKKLHLLLLILAMTACLPHRQEKGIDFRIKNKLITTITDVRLSTSERLEVAEFDSIRAGEQLSGFLSMKANAGDGQYVLEFTRADGKMERLGAGYYTNGGPLDRLVTFKIKPDTTLVSFRTFFILK